MKKILFLLLLLFPLLLFSQTEQKIKETYYQYEVEEDVDEMTFIFHQDWKIEASDSWGSFMWCVIRSENKDADGYYWYYIYISSNAYFNRITNGEYQKAIAYIQNININMYTWNGHKDDYESTYNLEIPYATCDHGEVDPSSYIAYFYSTKKHTKFTLKYESTSAYDNSKTNE